MGSLLPHSAEETWSAEPRTGPVFRKLADSSENGKDACRRNMEFPIWSLAQNALRAFELAGVCPLGRLIRKLHGPSQVGGVVGFSDDVVGEEEGPDLGWRAASGQGMGRGYVVWYDMGRRDESRERKQAQQDEKEHGVQRSVRGELESKPTRERPAG
ncbi:hypothetical protein DXG03_000197 [Asterophora parasitica]|uniref:Uncharacterized protein n=1 Tax=Asterophora parasitica TaxID=117018 RepID=A0A9P7GF09_9AGAR|nr:hypothetical protein DXG03_000197 [Asterophora parasitica]